MATLAYPVVKSTNTILFGPQVKPSVDTLKPSGKSFNSITNVNWKWVLDTNKPSGKSYITTTFEQIGIPLDTKKLSTKLQNSSLIEANQPKLKATVWYTNNIKDFIPSTTNKLAANVYSTAWSPIGVSSGQLTINPMYSGNITIGQLSTPYLYELFSGSTLMTSMISIVNSNVTTPVETLNNEKMLTLETGCVLAYGELQRNNGWSV